jgi:DNA-binding CsgD family transcriptional regulator
VTWGPTTAGERLACAGEMLEMVKLTGDSQQASNAHGYLHTIHLERGEREQYERHLRESAQLSAHSLHPFMAWATRLFLTCLSLLDGRYDEALGRAQSALELGRRTSINSVDGAYSLQMFSIARDRGQLPTLRPVLERFLKESSSPPWEPGLALLYAELGMAAQAREVLERVASTGFSAVPRDHAWPGAMAYLAEVCAFLQDEVRSAQIHELLLPYAHCAIIAGGVIVCLGSGSRFLGLLSSVRRRWAEAESHFDEALARTRHDFAAMLLQRRRGDDVNRASELVEQALKDARQMGMAALVAQLEAVVQAAAAHHGKRSDYPDGLTARELEVLRLIAEGATHRGIATELFISEKTVHSHVSSVLAKTGCANRTEAASYALKKHLA